MRVVAASTAFLLCIYASLCGCMCASSEEEVDEDGNPKPKKIKFSEAHRLAYAVASIDAEVSVVPRGAFVVTSTHYVIRNSGFGGVCCPAACVVLRIPR